MAILWSGGADSTLLLHDLATKAKEDHQIVKAITIMHPQILNSTFPVKYRERTLKQLKNQGLDNITHHIINIQTEGQFQIKNQIGLLQPIIWMTTVIPYLNEKEDLYVAYIREDDIWHYRYYLYDAFNSLQVIAQHTGQLLIPFEWTYKYEILRRLKQLNLTNTWTCENPQKNKPCGKCQPCKNQRIAKYINRFE
jgi:7-cyano-7-deazaguanine synthase in queuosine biosynthesis